jgi:two-component system, cell cycle sensor histidine kinase and response regulator CckA
VAADLCAAGGVTAALRLAEPQEDDVYDGPDRATVPVLVVDDNAGKRLAIRSVLAPLGYSVVEADSGSAALRCVMAQDFAVILLDVRMPIMDGFETAAHIRRRRQSEMTPIIFITAHGSDEIANTDLYAEGAVDFIFAPVPPSELRAKVSAFANLFAQAAELAARAREVQAYADQLRLLTDAAPIGIFQTDPAGRYVYTNPRWSELTGIPAAEAVGQDWDALARSKLRAGSITELTDDAEREATLVRRFEIRGRESAARIVLATSEAIPNATGGTAGRVGTLADVTAAVRQREAELARLDAEARYRTIVETTMEGIWLIDGENRTTFVNEAMARMLATTVEEMQGRLTFDYCDDAGHAQAKAALARRRAGVSEQHEMKLRRSDGTEMHALVSATSLLDESGAYSGSLTMIRDVTESVAQDELRERLEDELRHSHRLESIGHLAGGIAHDFNNLLLAIRGYGELALQRLGQADDTAGGDIRDLLAAADQATQLTRQLLAFGRRQVLQPQVIDLREVVADMEKLLRQLIGDQVELVTTAPEEPVLVDADRTQLEQVIANLAVNARDAMPDGGRVAIEVAQPGLGGTEGVLSVSDTGTGMDAETAAHVFEPFFSTKGSGGSGFGLATVHGIVSQSGGRIVLDTTPGGGTTFSIFLPVSEGVLTSPPPAPAEAEGGADTILVVEDDPSVRTIVSRMLENLGYRVLTADGGEAAIELAASLSTKVDLILTDLAMPGLGGRETAERVRVIFPAAKVLYMSGYTDDLVVRGGGFEPGVTFIQKPFGAADLAARVRDVLDSPGSAPGQEASS